MNYAATLAFLMVLTFCFPITVHFVTLMGTSEAVAVTITAGVFIFVCGAYFVRWRVTLHRQRIERLQQVRAQVAQNPTNANSYFVSGQHFAVLLLHVGRRREAAEVVDRYARLGGAKESEILALREALSVAQVRKRRN